MSLADRLEAARRDLAKAEATEEAARKEQARALAKLREVLGCEAGQEKAALKKLEEEVREAEAEVAAFLDRAEAKA
jgi:hypothetical protein